MRLDKFIQVDKSAFKILINMLELKNLKCNICGKKITSNNFGLIAKDLYSCNNTLCMMEAIDEFEGIK